ncbi:MULTISPECIES: hypothetical protein [Pseudomonas]|jgi:hypothetical protein|uniref:hypothetical protein n=1 Tax=Pseudomonas TaxID=286 RepID=UPI0007E36694|nr:MULTISPECIES: hypothetical protein [Pseudomonas]
MKTSKVIKVAESLSVVLIDRLGQESLFDEAECSRNIYLIDEAGRRVWQVFSDFDAHAGPFTNIILNERGLKGYRWDGGMYEIDIETGRAVPGEFMK